MGLVVSIVLLAAGAVLLFGLDRSVSGVEASTIGAILIVLGALVAVASLVNRNRPRARRALVETPAHDAPVPAEPRVDETWPRPRPPR